VCMSVSQSVCLSVCLPICLSVCPSVRLCVRQSYIVPRHRYGDWSAVDTLKNGEREEKRVEGRKSKGGKKVRKEKVEEEGERSEGAGEG
jgi:hypothetical protein